MESERRYAKTNSDTLVLEGTWEEIQLRSRELKGKRVRLTVLPSEHPAEDDQGALPYSPAIGPSTAESLLKYVGTWEGDDIKACLDLVYASRSKARF